MSTLPFMAQVQIFSFNFAPQGWAMCNGQLLPINQNQALFSLLGTTYGGNGQTNFGLPNLQGKVPLHFGASFTLGQTGGETAHTLTLSEMPSHTHQAKGSSDGPGSPSPSNAYWPSNTGFAPYDSVTNTTMAPAAVSNIGGSQPHNNMSPYLVLNFCIALQGVFPSRN
jgi:microcystin-dependent protein